MALAAPAFAQQEPINAALPQPRLEGRWLGLAAEDTPASLWWSGPAERDARGPATLADALANSLAGVPALVAGPAPGNGTAALITLHGRAQPGLVLGRILLPGAAPLLPGLFDADLLLAAPPGGLGEAAGEVTLSLRRPGEKLAGMGEFAAGGFASRRALARIDLPLAKGVRVGLGGHLQDDRGWMANTATGERLNRGRRAGASATLDVDLAPALSLAVTSLYAGSQAGNLPASACDPNAPARCGGRFASAALDNWGPISADLAGQPPGQRADLTLNDVRLRWSAQRVTVELGAGLARQTGRLRLDAGEYGLIARTLDDSQGIDLVGEAQLGALTLRAGAAYTDAGRRRDSADSNAGIVIADRRIAQHDSRRTLFGQARLDLRGGVALDAGLRVVRQWLRLDVEDRRALCSPCLGNAGPGRLDATLVTPEFALSWRASPQLLIYARSARSARLPGWNLLARTSAELVLLPAETGWHHQAGMKADLLDGRLRVNASGFSARTQALVSPLFGIDPLAMANNPRLDMNNHGIDVVAQANPIERLELAASLGWQRARWAGAVPVSAPPRPLYAPDTTAGLSAAWHQPLPGTGSVLAPRITARWRSRMGVAAGTVLGPAFPLADGTAPGGWQVAAALQLEIPDGGWLMSLECENCLDRTLTDGAVAGLATLNPPRWWQLRFTRRF